jgi:uncharacterized protein (TIGR02271 family)
MPRAKRSTPPTPQSLPLAEEQVEISKREVETGRVRISKRVVRQPRVLEGLLRHEDVHIERVALNREVDVPPSVRCEGDCVIVPVLEEVAEVRKRLVLKEELHIRRTRTDRAYRKEVVLRREEASVQRRSSPTKRANGSRSR